MEIANALQILGLTHRASLKEAKSAYRHLAKTWHPDLVQGTPDDVRNAEERMKKLNVAYRCVTTYLVGRKSPPTAEKPGWWSEKPPPPASSRTIRRPAWFRGFTFDDPPRDGLHEVVFLVLGAVLFVGMFVALAGEHWATLWRDLLYSFVPSILVLMTAGALIGAIIAFLQRRGRL